MNNADRLPLLLFQGPVPTPKARGFGSGSKFNPRSSEEVAGYLGPKLTRLEQVLEAERIRVQATGAGIEPEMALVIELATDLGSFLIAARGIGLEWLAEDEIDLDPSETIFPINAKGERQDKPFHGRLFLTMTDRRALDQLLSRWARWRDDPKANWPRGKTAWRDLFPLIFDIRPSDLTGTRCLRKLTITLAWLTPIAPHQRRYRKAQLWLTTDASDLIGVVRGPNGYDDDLIRRGTVQHEVFEGEKARAFTDGDCLHIQVNCREDAAGLDEEIDYGLVVSFEVGENVPVAVYDKIRQRLRSAVSISSY